MGASKFSAFPPVTNRIAQLAKALGHPARIAIVEYLAKQPGCIGKTLVGELPLSQSTISQHLQELKNAGVIRGIVQGPKTCYCLDPVALDDLQRFIMLTTNEHLNHQSS